MNNPLTDTLKLVHQEEGHGTFHIFRRKRAEKYSFCLVVFRGKAFLGYIPSSDITVEGDILRRYERIGIKNGDTILSVNLGPQPLEISDTLPTRDGYPCDYRLILDIRVIDPVKFAQQYVQETDPVARAKTAIEGHIQQCSGHYSHDDMNDGLLREFAEESLTIEPNADFGLTVVKAQKATLFMNPTRAREREIARNRAIEEQWIQSEGYLSRVQKQEDIDLQTLATQGELDVEQLKIEAKRKQDEIDAELARQEEIKRQEHEHRKSLADLEEQLKQQGYTHQLESNTTQQRFLLEKAQTRHGHEVEEMNILEKYKQQVRIHEIDVSEAQHKLELDRIAWESQMRQNWIAEVGKGAIPALTTRIREQITDDKSSLSGAVNEPELQYMLDILKGTEEVSLPQPQLRHLHARLPERVRAGDRITLQVRVALSPAPNKSTPLRAFTIPYEGADLKLVLECPGFLLHSASIARVHVTPTADSDWVLFELEALHEGVYTLEILAFNGGAFLGTLSLQLTVDSLAVRAHSVDCVTLLPLRSPQEGEVTLVIRYDPHSAVYRYQFRSTTFGETDELRSGPLRRGQEEAVADLVALLNEQARDLTEYSAEETRRWLQGKGVELWKELIPKELENLFWQQRENIKWMTILSAGDPMPWEMMYPTNDAGDDAGFLAEQFPIVRWIFGSAPTTQLHCSQPFFVVPDDAPLTAEDELAALRRIMGEGQNINDLTPLLKVFDNADFDSLHFACHNIFRSDSPTSSSIQLGSKRFAPTFLNIYNKHFHSPLIFMNACRSDGMAANYTWLAGWAKSFLAAGAGAFIGSLWEVRDSSASHFAETFYQALHSGIPLGDAMKQARTAIQNEPGDPTWLAYTLYGNPTAILLKEAPEFS